MRVGIERRRYEPKREHPVGVLEREAKRRLCAHRRAGEHRALDPQLVEYSA